MLPETGIRNLWVSVLGWHVACIHFGMPLNDELTSWDNLRLAYARAARGKRGRSSTAAFEYLLADNLLELQAELRDQRYQPGSYHSFYIHEPKR